MFGSNRNRPLLGLDVTTSSVKLIELVETGKGYRVESFAAEPTPANSSQPRGVRKPTALNPWVLRRCRIAPKSPWIRRDRVSGQDGLVLPPAD